MSTVKSSAVVVGSLVIALAVGLSGCGRGPVTQPEQEPPATTVTPGSTQPETPDVETGETTPVKVYFARGEKIGAAGRTVVADQEPAEIGYAAMQELLLGPSAQEQEFGLGTAVPAETRVNGVTVEDGVATVDLSEEFDSGGGSLSMQMRAAQVVCTLTQFESIDEVAFEIDGNPISSLGGEGVMVGPTVDRADFEDMLPPVLVESPTPGQTISSPVKVDGSSNVFEATHQIEVTDPEGKIVATKVVTAASGTGTRGSWSERIEYRNDYPGRQGAIIIFEYSAKDGSRINVVEIPVTME